MPLDLNLAGKKLTDDGLEEVLDGLKEVLSVGDSIPYFGLEELNLSGNDLTVKSLAALAPVIRISSCYIKDIDLSSNHIRVETEYEGQNWEKFLTSFDKCCCMRRLVLSNSSLSGSRPFEIFARVYSRHPAVERVGTPICPDQSSKSGSSAHWPSLSDKTNSSEESDILSSLESDMFLETHFIPRCGIRCLPYIILSNCELEDFGALWLSYIVENHHFPEQLMAPMRPGAVSTMLREYEENTECLGLVYYPNDMLSSTGRRLLAAAETARKVLSLSSGDDVERPNSSDSVRYSRYEQ
jgi:hypothetical protein